MPINGIDNIQDLIAAAQQTSAANNKNDKDKDQQSNEKDAQSSFNELLRGRLTSNIVFTNLETQMSVPKRATDSENPLPVLDRRPEPTSEDSEADTFDAATATDSSAKPVRNDDANRSDDQAQVGPVQDPTINATKNTGAEAEQKQAAGRTDNANTKNTGEQNAKGDTARADARTGVANTQVAQQDVDVELYDIATGKKNGNANANLKVTKEAAEVASQPQNTLTAKSALDVETSRKHQIRDGAARNADANIDIELQDSAQNVFNKAKNGTAAQTAAAQAAKAAAAKAAGNEGAGQAQAQAAQQNQQNANQAQNANFQAAVNANARSAVAQNQGSQGGQISVDAASGGTSVTGENNQVQQRSAPPKMPQAHARPNLPAHALADQVAVNIQRGISQGQDRITVQLRPAELGRVEIKMEMNHDGKMSAVIMAERPETLDMLRQDSRSLIDALNQAGLKTDANSLSFNLQGQNSGENQAQSQTANAGGGNAQDVPEDISLFDNLDDEMGGFTADGRLDFRV